MTITNGYLTRADLLREIFTGEDSMPPDAVDDPVMDDICTDASRDVDTFCGGRQFFASAQTLTLDPPVPYDLRVWFGQDVLAVQSVTNGDGASVASGNYTLWPRNANSYAAIQLNQGASVSWTSGSTPDGTLSIGASVGFVDRSASTPRAAEIIRNTHRAALIRAQILYRGRKPSSVYERTYKDADWQALVAAYVRGVY